MFETYLLSISFTVSIDGFENSSKLRSVKFNKMANFGLSEHQRILEKLCRICGERLKKAKDKYENSFLCADKREVIFTAFGVKIRQGHPTRI